MRREAWIPNLEPSLAVRPVFQLRHNPFQILFAYSPIELGTVPFNCPAYNKTDGCAGIMDSSKFTFNQWARSQVLLIEPKQVEGVEHRIATAA